MDHVDLTKIELKSGGHTSFEEGACVMEAVSYFAHEKWSDHPKCVSPVIGAFLRRLNDGMSDERRQTLRPYIERVVGTATGAADDKKRMWLAVDWSVHTFAPAWLDRAGLTAEAKQLRDLPTIDSTAAAKAATEIIQRVRDAARAKRTKVQERIYAADADDAAYAADAADAADADDAAYAADAADADDADDAAYAAYAAAADAAYADDAAYAAYAAAADAADAAYAAYAAAADAAYAAYAASDLKGLTYGEKKAYFRKKIDAALSDTIKTTQASTLDLIDRMIAVGKDDDMVAKLRAASAAKRKAA